MNLILSDEGFMPIQRAIKRWRCLMDLLDSITAASAAAVVIAALIYRL